jgi:hypothetical protein
MKTCMKMRVGDLPQDGRQSLFGRHVPKRNGLASNGISHTEKKPIFLEGKLSVIKKLLFCY